MTLEPKRPKYRRQFQKGAKAISPRGASLAFGDYGLKVLGRGFVTAQQIEAGRRAIAHFTKRGGRIWIRVFPDKPVTGKAPGSGMGGGKGETKVWVVLVTPGKIIFELGGVEKGIAKEALERASHKIGLKTIFIARD